MKQQINRCHYRDTKHIGCETGQAKMENLRNQDQPKMKLRARQRGDCDVEEKPDLLK